MKLRTTATVPSFLSERRELMRERSPLYYTRLESDRACTLSMVCLWHRLFPEIFERKGTKASKNNLWHGKYHGSFYTRGENRMAAFTWISAERPMGSIVPPTDSSMAESKFNLVSFLEGAGVSNYCELKENSGRLYDGGFITGGEFNYITEGLLEENDKRNTNARNRLVYCALPDDRTVVTMQRCTALRRCWLLRVKPLNYNMPNDIWNGETRDYVKRGNSLTVDGKLTITGVYGGDVRVYHNEKRTIGLTHLAGVNLSYNIIYGDRGMLRVDELLIGGSDKPAWYPVESTIFDIGAVIRTDDKAAEAESFADGDVRAIRVIGADGQSYLVAANFGDAAYSAEILGVSVSLEAGGYAVFADGASL